MIFLRFIEIRSADVSSEMVHVLASLARGDFSFLEALKMLARGVSAAASSRARAAEPRVGGLVAACEGGSHRQGEADASRSPNTS